MRKQNWQTRFSEFGKARASLPFAWGSNDCCTFAAAGVEALTGRNLIADLESYTSEVGAAKLIARAGGLRALASQYLGDAVSPLMAAVGDVVLVMNEGREMLAICNGANAVAPGEHGMVTLSMDSATAAWRV